MDIMRFIHDRKFGHCTVLTRLENIFTSKGNKISVLILHILFRYKQKRPKAEVQMRIKIKKILVLSFLKLKRVGMETNF